MEQISIGLKNTVTKQPEFIKYVSFSEINKMINNPLYSPIFTILQAGPKTISEIHTEYTKFLENELTKKLAKDKNAKTTKTEKSENTIYKYIKELKEANLVIECGHQIDLEKPSMALKNLYCLSACFILPENDEKIIFSSEIGSLISEVIGVFLSRLFDDLYPHLDDFQTLLIDISSAKYEHFISFFQSLQSVYNNSNSSFKDELANNLSLLPSHDYFNLLNAIQTIIWLKVINDKKIDYSSIKDIFTESSSLTLKDTDINAVVAKSRGSKATVYPNGFVPKVVMSVSHNEWEKYFANEDFNAIFFILRAYPMTVQEITERHFQTLQERYVSNCKMCDEFAKDKSQFHEPKDEDRKSENTIYRYIKELINAGYIAEFGRIVVPDKKAAQILYTRSANVYITWDEYDESFSSGIDDPINTAFLNILGLLLPFYFKKNNVKDSFKRVFFEFVNKLNEARETAFKEIKHDSIADATRKFNGQELHIEIKNLTIFEFLLANDLDEWISKIESCFE